MLWQDFIFSAESKGYPVPCTTGLWRDEYYCRRSRRCLECSCGWDNSADESQGRAGRSSYGTLSSPSGSSSRQREKMFFVPCHRHNSELAFSQGLSHLKVFKWQFWGLFLVVFEIDKLGRWRPGVRVVGRGRRSNIFKSFLVGGLGIFGSVTLKGLICVGLLAKNISFRQSFIIVVARGKFLGHVYFGLCFLFDPRWWKFLSSFSCSSNFSLLSSFTGDLKPPVFHFSRSCSMLWLLLS